MGLSVQARRAQVEEAKQKRRLRGVQVPVARDEESETNRRRATKIDFGKLVNEDTLNATQDSQKNEDNRDDQNNYLEGQKEGEPPATDPLLTIPPAKRSADPVSGGGKGNNEISAVTLMNTAADTSVTPKFSHPLL